MNGFFNIDKPTGMTSAAVVAVMRRLTGEKRVGHAGTLDPEAAGVLPIMIGKAARLFDYLVDKQKEYEAVIAFGTRTDTQDATGQVLETGDHYPPLERVRAMARTLEGTIVQRPSMYSAIKVGGKPLYSLARRGETVEVPERLVRIDGIEVLREAPDHGAALRVRCGKGTYIRTLCEDLGKACGCPAHMRSLTRTRSGFFTLDTSMTLEQARTWAEDGSLEDHLIAPDAPLTHLPRMDAPAWLGKWVKAGARLELSSLRGDAPEEAGITRLYLENQFWGILEREGEALRWRAQIAPEGGASEAEA